MRCKVLCSMSPGATWDRQVIFLLPRDTNNTNTLCIKNILAKVKQHGTHDFYVVIHRGLQDESSDL